VPIIFFCPKCGWEIRVRSAAAGQQGTCTDCGEKVVIPRIADFRTNMNLGLSSPDLPTGFLKDREQTPAE